MALAAKRTDERPTRVTEAAVFAACDDLVLAGEPLTFENVRRITKVGSPNTIYADIRSYQKVLPERIRARQGPQVPDLPEDIATHFIALWRQATGAARETAESAVARERAELDARAAALDQTAKALERRETELGHRLTEMGKRLKLQDDQLREADERARAADTARLAAITELERARYRITELEKSEKLLTRTLQEAEQAHTAALAALRAEHKGALAERQTTHAQELAELEARHESDLARRDATVATAEKRAQQLDDALTAARREGASVEAVLQERTLELERVSTVLAETRKDAARLRDASEARSNALAELRARLEVEQEARKAAEAREAALRDQQRRQEDQVTQLTQLLATLSNSKSIPTRK